MPNPSQNDMTLNRDSIFQRLGGNQELLNEIIGLFSKEGPQLIEAMRAALLKGDMPGVARSAHSIKGAVSNFFAYNTANTASQLENDAKKADVEAVKTGFVKLENAVAGLLIELAGLCQESSK